MAEEIIKRLIDDLDGTDADEKVIFGLDGQWLEIDLTTKNASALRKALEKYVGAARRHYDSGAPRRGRPVGSKAPAREYDIGQLREWAAKNNITVAPRGRVAQSIVDQYKADGGS